MSTITGAIFFILVLIFHFAPFIIIIGAIYYFFFRKKYRRNKKTRINEYGALLDREKKYARLPKLPQEEIPFTVFDEWPETIKDIKKSVYDDLYQSLGFAIHPDGGYYIEPLYEIYKKGGRDKEIEEYIKKTAIPVLKQKYLEYGNFYSKAFYANIYPQDNIVKAFNELLKNTDDTPAQYASKETLSIDNFYSFINYPRENLLKELDTAKYNDSVKKKLTSVKSKNSQILFSDIEKSVKILRNLVEREELAACITTIFTTCIESYDSFIKTWVTDEYLKKELSHTIQKLNLFRIWTSDLKAKGEFNRLKIKTLPLMCYMKISLDSARLPRASKLLPKRKPKKRSHTFLMPHTAALAVSV